MPYPFGPNTLGVVQEIQTLLTNLKLSDGITPAYSNVILGGEKNYVNLVPCAVIVLGKDDSERHAHGGTIVEPQEITIRSVVDYSVASTAELAIIAIRDVLMPTLQKYCTLQGTPGVYHSQVKKGSARFAWMWLKPDWYRVHEVELEVHQYYLIQGGIQA